MNKLGRILKSGVAKNAGWLIGGSIVQKMLAFVVGIYTARFLGPGNYGLINYASAYLTFFYAIATLGINNVLVKKLVDNPEREGEVLGTTLFLQCLSSIFSILIILGIVFILDYNETLTITVVFLSSIGLFFQVLDSIKYWFQAKLQSKFAAIATLIAYFISSLYKIVLLILGKSVEWFALATSLDYFCVAAFLIIVYKIKKGQKFRFSKELAKEIVKSSYPYIFSGLMASIYAATDKFMLKQMVNEETVGWYGTAVTVANVWTFILSAIIDSFNPVIMGYRSSNFEQYRKTNIKLYRIVFYCSLFVSIIITVFADIGISVLYGEAYKGAIGPLRIVTWYVAFSYLGVARNAWIVCENQQKYITPIYVGSAVMNVILNLIFIPVWGTSGAAFASLITQICTVFVYPFFIKNMRGNVKLMLEGVLFIKQKY